jgi:general secretion pathway protein M
MECLIMNDSIHKRWLAFSLFIVFILITLLMIVLPLFLNWLDSYEKKSELEFNLHRQQAILAIKDQVSENLEAINKQFQSQNYFSNQESESLASAELQNVIKMAIGQYGGQLVSTQGLPSENQKQFLKIVVSVRLMTNAEALASVLAYLESNTPIMVIDQLDISPIRSSRNNNIGNQNYPLNVNFKIFSLMRLKS